MLYVHASCACVMCMRYVNVHASCWTCLWRAAWHPGRPRLPPNGQWLCQSPLCCTCCCLKRALRLPPVATQPQHRAIERKGFSAAAEQGRTLRKPGHKCANTHRHQTQTSIKHKTRPSTRAHKHTTAYNSTQQHTTVSCTYHHQAQREVRPDDDEGHEVNGHQRRCGRPEVIHLVRPIGGAGHDKPEDAQKQRALATSHTVHVRKERPRG
jgi:hypothetical protein